MLRKMVLRNGKSLVGSGDVPLVTNDWQSTAGDRGCLALHPETPNPEVPLGLFDGVRTWLGFLLGFMFLYFFFLVISPDVSWHHSAFEKGFAS